MKIVLLGQVPSQKNRKPIARRKDGSSYPYTPKEVKDWQNDALKQLMAYRGRAEGRVVMTYQFYVKDNRRRDLTNMMQAVEDILVKAGLLKDDCWQYVGIGGADAEIDKANPRVEVYIDE